MKSTAIAFDFDGTLIDVGWDKGVHLVYAAWVACAECGLGEILRPDDLDGAPKPDVPGLGTPRDVERIVRAYLHYSAAPRFQQLSVVVNCLAHDRPVAVDDPAKFGLGPELTARYPAVRERFNEIYSGLNDIAAERTWRPYPSVKPTLKELARDHDLYVCSGLLEDLVQRDAEHHGLDRSLFQGVWGASRSGAPDKAALLRRIRARGYPEVLFVGDSAQDQEYALAAGAKFFRIQDDASYGRLLAEVRKGKLPHQQESWDYSPEQVRFYHEKTRKALAAYVAGKPMTLEAISAWLQE